MNNLYTRYLLSITLAILFIAACQSQPAKNETSTIPTPNSVPSVSSGQNNFTTERPTHNPAHGLPYHDCRIPVGAPLVAGRLPAPAGTPAQPRVQTLPMATSTNGTALNPPHGQPGHRCDIRVGDPLPVAD